MVELLIALSIALTIAVVGIQLFPTLTDKTRTSEARRTLELAIISQTTYASSHDGFAIESSELPNLVTARSITFTSGSSGNNGVVSVTPTSDGGIAMAIFVSNGDCLGVVLSNPFTSGDVGSVITFNGVCSADSLLSQ